MGGRVIPKAKSTEVPFVVYVNQRGSVRVTKRLGDIREGEVAVNVSVEIPNSFWRVPTLQAHIKIPDETAPPLTINADTSKVAAEALHSALGVSVNVTVQEPEED